MVVFFPCNVIILFFDARIYSLWFVNVSSVRIYHASHGGQSHNRTNRCGRDVTRRRIERFLFFEFSVTDDEIVPPKQTKTKRFESEYDYFVERFAVSVCRLCFPVRAVVVRVGGIDSSGVSSGKKKNPVEKRR